MTRHGVWLLFLGLLFGSNPVSADDSWHFRLSPYIWFAGLASWADRGILEFASTQHCIL